MLTSIQNRVRLVYSWQMVSSPLTGAANQRWLICALIFVLYALGGHTFGFTQQTDVSADQAVAVRDAASPLRWLGFGVLMATALPGLPWSRSLDRWVHPRLLACMIATFTWTALSFWWSDSTYLSIKTLIGTLLLWIGCAGIARQMTVEALRLAALIYTSSACLIGFCWEVVSGQWRPFASDYRFCGTVVDPNAQGLACAVLAATLLSYSPRGQWLKMGRVAAIAAALSLLLLTQSRGAIMALATSCLVVWGTRSTQTRRVMILGALCVPVFILSASLISPSADVARRMSAIVTLDRDTQAGRSLGSARSGVWETCITEASKHPFVGFGYGAFWSEKRMEDMQDTLGWTVTQSHCGYLELVLDIGLFGLAAFLASFVGALAIYWRRLRREPSESAVYGVSILVLFLIGMLLESVTATTYVTNVLALCLVAREGLKTVHTPFAARAGNGLHLAASRIRSGAG